MADQANTEKRMNIKEVFNPLVIKRGIFIFIVISLVALIGIFLYTNTGKTVEVWSQVNPLYLLLGLVFIFNDIYIGGLRNHIFMREFVS